MMRPTTVVLAAFLFAIAWTPARPSKWPIGPADLAAQQHAAVRAHESDEDSDTASDDSNDDSNSDDEADTPTPDHHGSGPRTLDVARMVRGAHDTAALLHVDLSYGTGTLRLLPADPQWLYNVRLNYVPDHDAPSVSYDTGSHSLHVSSSSKHGGHGVSIDFGDHSDHGDEELRVALARVVPLDIRFAFGAGDARAQLGGLSVKRLRIETGASDAQLSFNSPDPIPLDDMDVAVGAAGFKATGLGNAHVRHMTVKAGAGDVDLDFGGRWTGDATLEITAALGAVHIHVPRGVVVQRSGKVFIGSTDDATGATTQPQSPGGPLYHLRVHSTMTLGSVEFDRKTAN
jgi:hypothetical protein